MGQLLLPPDPQVRWRRLELMGWAFLLSLAFYPGYLGFLAWFSLVRPLWIISRLTARAAFGAAYWWGFWFNLFSIYWVALVTPPGTIAAVVIVGFYYAVMLMIYWRLHQVRPLFGLVAVPLLWAGLEYFRTLSQFAFPWSDLGYTQSYYLYVIQIVSVVSVHGLTVLIVAVNVLLWQVLRSVLTPERRVTALFCAVGIIVALLAFGWIVVPPYPEPGQMPVALLQGSLTLQEKFHSDSEKLTFEAYGHLADSVADSADLIIWPETAAHCYLENDPFALHSVRDIVMRSRKPHLVGTLRLGAAKGRRRYYNACYQFGPDGSIQQQYSKVKLVPFSEHVPYQDFVPFMEENVLRKYLTFIDRMGVQWWSDFYPGDSMVLFQIPDAAYGVLICFETTFPEFVRQYIRRGAQFIVGITNDTWFGRSVGIHMHARIFVTRAIENRCWMVRAANTGLTFVVDPYGRIRSQLPLYQEQALVARIGLLDEYSFFTRHGDVAGRLGFLFAVSATAILVFLWLLRKVLAH